MHISIGRNVNTSIRKPIDIWRIRDLCNLFMYKSYFYSLIILPRSVQRYNQVIILRLRNTDLCMQKAVQEKASGLFFSEWFRKPSLGWQILQ